MRSLNPHYLEVLGNMNETILLELQLKLAEAQRDVAIAERDLVAFLSNLATHEISQQDPKGYKTGVLAIMLIELQQHGDLTTDVLAQRCNASVQTMRVTLHRAKKKGLVKTAKADGLHQFKKWSLTQKGALERNYLV